MFLHILFNKRKKQELCMLEGVLMNVSTTFIGYLFDK